jgi:PTH1 family peptidyl-tRNA hydrolase
MSSERWLIVGLGNPGPQYEMTRHNVGFLAIHRLAEAFDISAKGESKFNAIVGSGTISETPVILAQPLTYMNLSGEAVSKITRYYNIPPEHILVIYDDAALPFGKLRIRPSGSAGGQNGMKSIIQHLSGNEQFPRLRIGIGQPKGQQGLSSHVLSKFNAEEQKVLPKVLDIVVDAAKAIVTLGDIPQAMSQFNGVRVE